MMEQSGDFKTDCKEGQKVYMNSDDVRFTRSTPCRRRTCSHCYPGNPTPPRRTKTYSRLVEDNLELSAIVAKNAVELKEADTVLKRNFVILDNTRNSLREAEFKILDLEHDLKVQRDTYRMEVQQLVVESETEIAILKEKLEASRCETLDANKKLADAHSYIREKCFDKTIKEHKRQVSDAICSIERQDKTIKSQQERINLLNKLVHSSIDMIAAAFFPTIGKAYAYDMGLPRCVEIVLEKYKELKQANHNLHCSFIPTHRELKDYCIADLIKELNRRF